ncbi:MAG TPA: aldose 1-epimerase family protein [Steroidobacteraceae bacterium]|nr:aldose 1-epimerase family protein [Steroidobacteraceae bacterium]
MSTTPSGWLRIHSHGLSAQIDPQGAQLSVLRDAAGRDLLWNGDAAIWKGRAPILFPIVGALHGGQYQWRGARFALPRHGFARDRRFTVIEHDPGQVRLRLADDAATRAIYPFHFALELHFQLGAAGLTTTASVHNPAAAPLPASIGFHPALRWPLPYGAGRAAHCIEFEHEEPAPIRRLDAQGLLTPAPHATPVRGRRLLLDDALFRDDVIIFDQLRSRSLRYGAAQGPHIQLDFPDAMYLGLWTKPGAGFLCIEPWRGVADPVDYVGEFDARPGVFLVAPGASQALQMRIALVNP